MTARRYEYRLADRTVHYPLSVAESDVRTCLAFIGPLLAHTVEEISRQEVTPPLAEARGTLQVARAHWSDVAGYHAAGEAGLAHHRLLADLLPMTRRLVAQLEAAGCPLVFHYAGGRVVASAQLRDLATQLEHPFTAPVEQLLRAGRT